MVPPSGGLGPGRSAMIVVRQSRLGSVTLVLVTLASLVGILAGRPAHAQEKDVEADAAAALAALYETTPAAKIAGEQAKAVLVFPTIVKAGFLVGVQYGEGVLMVDGKPEGLYNIAAASYGLQAGVQSFAYAMFLMTDAARSYLDRSAGWEIGVGPSVVVYDKGMAKSFTSTTLKDDVYAFAFQQKGLMAGIGLQGSKITRID
ncbi:MAG: lipid-binding SYLF domain-containing protein [Thermodesulfobacteriota bacterium]